MLRINLLAAVVVAAGVVGCAQCDTCDDFPTPCTGPNCGQAYGVPGDNLAPTMAQGMPATGAMGPFAAPTDAAGPAPVEPPAPASVPSDAASLPSPEAPAASNPASPPAPMEPAPQPK